MPQQAGQAGRRRIGSSGSSHEDCRRRTVIGAGRAQDNTTLVVYVRPVGVRRKAIAVEPLNICLRRRDGTVLADAKRLSRNSTCNSTFAVCLCVFPGQADGMDFFRCRLVRASCNHSRYRSQPRWQFSMVLQRPQRIVKHTGPAKTDRMAALGGRPGTPYHSRGMRSAGPVGARVGDTSLCWPLG